MLSILQDCNIAAACGIHAERSNANVVNVWASDCATGLDLSTVEACEASFKEIDDVVGLQYLRVSWSL